LAAARADETLGNTGRFNAQSIAFDDEFVRPLGL